eukprot:COSAG03_NODE_527_length_7151_cov_149.776943_4_plen_100_part_00
MAVTSSWRCLLSSIGSKAAPVAATLSLSATMLGTFAISATSAKSVVPSSAKTESSSFAVDERYDALASSESSLSTIASAASDCAAFQALYESESYAIDL